MNWYKIATQGLIDAETVLEEVQQHHRNPADFNEGDLRNRIREFAFYRLQILPVASLDSEEWYSDDSLVSEYTAQLKEGQANYPPIVYDPVNSSIIDGTHRVRALKEAGIGTVRAYVGVIGGQPYRLSVG